MVKSAFDGIPFRVEFTDAPGFACSLGSATATGDADGQVTGYFLVSPCPGQPTTSVVAVGIADDFVGETVLLPEDVIYDTDA